MDENNEIWFGAKGDAAPSRKTFLADLKIQSPPAATIWLHQDAGHNHEARDEIKVLVGANSFAGSGTTGHAVLQLNAELAAKERTEPKESSPNEDSLRSLRSLAADSPRRFILVELEAKIVRDLTAERVKRVALGYTNTKGEKVEGLGGGFRFCELGEPLFDATGHIRPTVTFAELARHVYFTETGGPLPRERVSRSPLLGVCRGVAVLAQLPCHAGPKVIYGAGCLLGPERLQSQQVTFRQTPYEIRVA